MIIDLGSITFLDVKYAIIYINIAKIYNDLKPKYITLYSKNPPNIAPIKFEYRMTEIDIVFFTSCENAKPEKNKGNVKKTGIIIIPIQLG